MADLTTEKRIEEPKQTAAHRPVVLRADGLRKAFGGHVVLADVSLELQKGQVILLRGDNGSGKTTLLNILTGGLEADSGRIGLFLNGTEERFSFPRHWWQNLNPFDHFTPERVARERVGRTWQDVRLFSTLDLLNNIAAATPSQTGENPLWAIARRPRMKREEIVNRQVAGVHLASLGLRGRETSSADRVSLGQSKRVAIARAVQAGAKLLFLDEPLAGLDNSGIDQVLELLDKLVTEGHLTLVIVEHISHIWRLLPRVDSIWTLRDGRIEVQQPATVRDEVSNHRNNGLHDWLRRLAGPKGSVIDTDLPGGALLSVARTTREESGNTVISLKDLVVTRGQRCVIGFPDERASTKGLSFALRDGDLAVLQAPNGWGKTTLLQALAGLLPVTSGEIRLKGRLIHNLPPWLRAQQGIAFLQSRWDAFPNLSVRDCLNLARVVEVPSGVVPLLNRRISHLSGGEKQRLGLATVLNSQRRSELKLLDEPFGMLDGLAVEQLQNSLRLPLDGAAIIALPRIHE